MHLLAPVGQDTDTVCIQLPVGTKTNTIARFSTLVDHFLDLLKGKNSTSDAMHTQTAHARYLHGRHAQYVFAVKGNQPKLQDELVQILWDQVPAGKSNHGNQERAQDDPNHQVRDPVCQG